MPRKFSYTYAGTVVPTSKAVSDGRHACIEYGLPSVANTAVGYVFGYMLRCLEDKDRELAEIRQEIKALKTPKVEESLVSVTEEFNPDGTKKAYKNMNAAERAAYRSKGE